MARRSGWSSLLAFIVLLTWSSSSPGQYMYLDANGDGIHDASDRLSADSTTTLEVWIDTVHNRDGSQASCSTGSDSLTINSYDFILHAEGGTIAWGQYTNLRTGMGISFGLAADSTDYHNGFGGGTANTQGLYHVGTLSVSVASGNPSIAFASTSALKASFTTAFGSLCAGMDMDNTLKLGTDWSDADGVGAPDLPPSVSAPLFVEGIEGTTIHLNVTAQDPNADQSIDSLVVDLSGLPVVNDASFDASADHTQGTLTWTPGYSDAGEYRVRFRAVNSRSGEAETITGVNNSESTVAGPAVRLQLPGPGFMVDAHFYAERCFAQGGLCTQSTYYAADSGQVYVPLTQYGTSCCYWDRILIQFHAWTPAANMEGDLAPQLDLHPNSNPSDRLTAYTVPADPWKVTTFAIFGKVQSFYSQTFNFSRASMTLDLFSEAEHDVSPYTDIGYNAGDYILWPGYASYFNQNVYRYEFVAAHEYGHAIQNQVYHNPPVCSENLSDCFMDNIFNASFCQDCANHDFCSGGQSYKGSWNEGMADAFGTMFVRAYVDPTAADPPNCTPPGPEWEGSIANYVLAVASRDSKAFMNTLRFGTLTQTGTSYDHAKTVIQFNSLWQDVNGPSYYIYNHVPGTFNASALYRSIIYGGTSGVEGTEAGGTRVRAFPSPAEGSLQLEIGRAPRSGAVKASLFDTRGRLARSVDLGPATLGIVRRTIPVNGLAAGIYFLRVTSGGKAIGKDQRIAVVK